MNLDKLVTNIDAEKSTDTLRIITVTLDRVSRTVDALGFTSTRYRH